MSADPTRPTLRVISGDATDEEIAAVLAVVAARRDAGPALGPGRARSEQATSEQGASEQARTWSAHGSAHRHVRAAFSPGPHGWKTSFWPR